MTITNSHSKECFLTCFSREATHFLGREAPKREKGAEKRVLGKLLANNPHIKSILISKLV